MALSITSTAEGLCVRITGVGRERFQQIVEQDRHHGFRFRQRHQPQLRFQHDAQRAFGADHHLRQIDGLRGIGEFVEVVAAYAPQNLRIPPVDLVLRAPRRGAARSGSSAASSESPAGTSVTRQSRRNSTMLPSAQQHRLLQHVVDGLAIEHAARAAGIVGHHAADGGAAGGGDIGRKAQPERRKLRVQFVQHDARLHAHPALFGIHFEQAAVIFRSIDLQPFADGLARLRRAAAAHGDRAAVQLRHRRRARARCPRGSSESRRPTGSI